MIFVDTSFFFALFSAKDTDHERVREVLDSLGDQRLNQLLVTTNHIVFETVRLTRRKINHPKAVWIGEFLYSEKMAQIHWTTQEEEIVAFAYMSKHKDQHYSPVDCLSFTIMDKLGIIEALTVDSHFTHRFIARPGPALSR